jgi:methylase of polypeptide subunit release factors
VIEEGDTRTLRFGSSFALYDRYMGPLLSEPYARLVAERAALLRSARILESAAGTGIVTRALNGALPEAQIVATDLNPGMLELAAQRLDSERVAFQPQTHRSCRSPTEASTSSSASSA